MSITKRELFKQAQRQPCPRCGYTPRRNANDSLHRGNVSALPEYHKCYRCSETFWPDAFRVFEENCKVCNGPLTRRRKDAWLECVSCEIYYVLNSKKRGITVT